MYHIFVKKCLLISTFLLQEPSFPLFICFFLEKSHVLENLEEKNMKDAV